MINDKSILTAFRDKRILVVDDERFSRGIVMRQLQPLEVLEAEDGAFALHQCLSHGNIGLVICDFNMPIMDGLHFLKSVRTGLEGVRNDTPVLMLTGTSDSALVRIALALDVDGFIVKPVSQTMLENRIKFILSHGRDIRAPDYYAGIEIDEAARDLLQSLSNPFQTKPASVKEEEPETINGRKVPLPEVPPTAVLAADIKAPTGELLLASGTQLSARLLQKLLDLLPLGVTPKEIWVTE